MQVLKFGGTSMGSADSILKVFNIVKKQTKNDKVVVVVSAMSGVTNSIIKQANLAAEGDDSYKKGLSDMKNRHIEVTMSLLPTPARQYVYEYIDTVIDKLNQQLKGIYLLKELSKSSLDKVVCQGEYLSAYILWALFHTKQAKAKLIDSTKIIKANNEDGGLFIDYKNTYKNVENVLEDDVDLFVIPGFMASDENDEVVTLGRGGSDFTAALFAAGINANKLEVWTDVSGIYTANPKIVPSAYPIKKLSYQEAMELSHFGAKVIYPPTLHPVLNKKIDVRVKNTFDPDHEGTLITSKPEKTDKMIKGLSSVSDISLINLLGSGMVGVLGISSRLFSALAACSVNVILISQASSEHSICVAVDSNDAERAIKCLHKEFAYELRVRKISAINKEDGYAIVSLVGENMNKTKGISGKAFSVLGKNGVNIHAIAQGASELNISMVVKKHQVRKTLNVLHEEFFLSGFKTVNLYIAGVGNVGNKLMEILLTQKEYIEQKQGVQLRVKGLSNSRNMVLNSDGISLQDWSNELSKGLPADIKEFVKRVQEDNYRNSIFIDNTASESVSTIYKEMLDSSVSVVTCNKIASSSAYANYKHLKDTARNRNVNFLFESNVGAGLPIINTINNLKSSGDEILKIEGVLSGSVNFILNEFYDGKSLLESVKAAMEAGYTEPDPRIDLSGVDVARKILILARESGYKLEMDQVAVRPFLPYVCFQKNSVDEFLESLVEVEDKLVKLRDQAKLANRRIRFIARYYSASAQVTLEEVDQDSPFYHIEGKDNLVVIQSKWYHHQPLIIKGAGAGAEVTASGIMADIMSIAGSGKEL